MDIRCQLCGKTDQYSQNSLHYSFGGQKIGESSSSLTPFEGLWVSSLGGNVESHQEPPRGKPTKSDQKISAWFPIHISLPTVTLVTTLSLDSSGKHLRPQLVSCEKTVGMSAGHCTWLDALGQIVKQGPHWLPMASLN